MITVWSAEHLQDIWLREDDSSNPPLEKVDWFGSTFSKGGKPKIIAIWL